MQRQMVTVPPRPESGGLLGGQTQLSKDDEAAAEEVPVRREDQEKINRFSRLHQREAVLEQQLAQKRVSAKRLVERVDRVCGAALVERGVGSTVRGVCDFAYATWFLVGFVDWTDGGAAPEGQGGRGGDFDGA